jgi:hypothetical protein
LVLWKTSLPPVIGNTYVPATGAVAGATAAGVMPAAMTAVAYPGSIVSVVVPPADGPLQAFERAGEADTETRTPDPFITRIDFRQSPPNTAPSATSRPPSPQRAEQPARVLHDGRAKRIVATQRGRQASETAQAVSTAVGRRWAELVGEERYAVFEEVLSEIVAARRTP